jgi:hypothetical protein
MIRTSSTSSKQHQHDQRARPDRRRLRGTQQPSLAGLVQRARRGLHRLVTPHIRPSELQAAVQRIQRGERQIHCRCCGLPLDLQVAAEVTGRVIARQRIGQRITLPAIPVGRLGQPRAVHPDVARILAPRAVRQRTPGEPALELLRHIREVDRIAHPTGEPICRHGGSPIGVGFRPGLSPSAQVSWRLELLVATPCGS